MPDTSGSLDEREYEMALAGVSSLLERLCQTGSIQELDLLPWAPASDCWRTPIASIRLPIREEVPKAPPLELDEASRLFRLARDQKTQQTERRRAQEQESLDAAYREDLEQALIQFSSQLRRCNQGRSACTALGEIVRRCSLEPRSTLVILITDAKVECDQAERAALPAGARTLIILVPSRNDDNVREREVRLANLKRLAPWAMVIPSFRLADESLDWASLLEDGGSSSSLTVSVKASSGSGR